MKEKKPIYMEIYEDMKEKIDRGDMKIGMRLESKRALSNRMNIGINTVENAYAMLLDEGYIEARERRGYFVAKQDLLLRPLPEKNKLDTKIKKKEYPYDFSYQGVDKKFPFALWKKLTKEAVDVERENLLRRGNPQGEEGLRESIAAYLGQSRGIKATKENIIITAGTEYLFQILFGLWREKAVFGIENPGFERWSLLFETNGISYVPLNMDDKGILPEEVKEKNVDILCITPSHQFPTGKIMPIGRRKELLQWAEKEKRYIIEDDYDGEFKYTGRPIPALKSIDTRDRVVYMGNFSNTLSPALRVSYMLLPDRLMARYIRRVSYAACPVSTLTQKTLELFIAKGFFIRHVNRMRKIYKEKRELILRELKHHSKIHAGSTEAGLHIILEIEEGQDEKKLCLRAREQGILIHGISRYAIGSYTGKPALVMGFAGLEKEKIKEGLQVLKKIVRE